MGQQSLPTATFPRPPGVPGPIPFSFSLLGHHGTEQMHSYLPAPQPGARTLPHFQQEGCAPLLFLTKPSPPGTVGPASLMPTEMQIPRGSWGGSRAWLGTGKKQGEKGRFLHPSPWHNVGMVTPSAGNKAAGARRPPTPKSQTLPPATPHSSTCPPPREGDFAESRWCPLVRPSGCPHPSHRCRLNSS